MSAKKPLPRRRKPHAVADKIPQGVRRAPATFEEINGQLRSAGWGRHELTKEIEQAFCNIGVSS